MKNTSHQARLTLGLLLISALALTIPGYQPNPEVNPSLKLGGNSAAKAVAGLLPEALSRLLNALVPAAEAAIPAPPGGPILLVGAVADPFGGFYAEILRTEGFNAFAVAELSTLNAAKLSQHDIVILAPARLSAKQVRLLGRWVKGGGKLIASRPDVRLSGLLGLTATGGVLTDAYWRVDGSRPPGAGIAGQSLQFHGSADRYRLNGATSVAGLYSDAATATANPALSLRRVGRHGGLAAAFSYDLARSIVYTRQGNPAWAMQERDGIAPIRPDDLFYGNAGHDPKPDWVDLNNIAIPQADEQQRLLANLIVEMSLDKKPLPHFWYFPDGKKAVVIMTGDDHGKNGTTGRFNQFLAKSPAGCKVEKWQCVRGSSYLFPSTPLSADQAAAFAGQGFELGVHINTNCADYTPVALEAFYSRQLADWRGKYPGLPAPVTERHHCIAWSGWSTVAETELKHGVRLDTSYYFWPPTWVNDKPGVFTGSALPMRFTDLQGRLIDVYQAATQMTDESGQSYPYTIDTLLDRALGDEGYYGAYTINAHTDVATEAASDAVLDSALRRGVAIVSAAQMLRWLDARNSSSFAGLAWQEGRLWFSVKPGSGADGLQALLPVHTAFGTLTAITARGERVPFTLLRIKGIDYAAFLALAGDYGVSYGCNPGVPGARIKARKACAGLVERSSRPG